MPYTQHMGNLLERVRTAIKLRRGQCDNCRTVLRDDATGRFCSDQCEHDAWMEHAAY